AHRRLLAGAPAWLVHRPPRTGDLRRHLPRVAALLARQEPRAAVVSNAPDLFPGHPLLPAGDAVELWLERGTCRPRDPVAVVVVDWDRWQRGVPEEAVLDRPARDPAALRQRVAARCPGTAPVMTPRAAVWLLPGEAAP
ncbi:MAG TPA: hypothetical protein VHQ65_15200, partial [Thermoanaerobaculia bacterium]|nr:hypothetical protein [Thermoanaerobaculia bacterium]